MRCWRPCGCLGRWRPDVPVAAFATDFIPLELTAGQPVTVRHGLGRAPKGYLVIWSDAPVALTVTDPEADARTALTLTPSATCSARLVLL